MLAQKKFQGVNSIKLSDFLTAGFHFPLSSDNTNICKSYKISATICDRKFVMRNLLQVKD